MKVRFTRGCHLGEYGTEEKPAAAKDDVLDLPEYFARQVVAYSKAQFVTMGDEAVEHQPTPKMSKR